MRGEFCKFTAGLVSQIPARPGNKFDSWSGFSLPDPLYVVKGTASLSISHQSIQDLNN